MDYCYTLVLLRNFTSSLKSVFPLYPILLLDFTSPVKGVYSLFLLRLTSRFYFFLKKCILSILLLISSLKGVFSVHFVLLLDFTSFLKGVFSLYWICYLTLLSSEKECPVYTLLGFYSFPAEILCLRNPAADEIKKFCGIFPGFRYFIFSFSVQW